MCDIYWLIVILYAFLYANMEMLSESNEIIMCEQLHRMKCYLTMLLCVLFIMVWLGLLLCQLDQVSVPKHTLDRVSYSNTYIGSDVTFQHTHILD